MNNDDFWFLVWLFGFALSCIALGFAIAPHLFK